MIQIACSSVCYVNFLYHFVVEFSLQEVHFDIGWLIFLFGFGFVGVRVELFFHFVCLPDVLEFVGLEEVQDLLAYSAGSGHVTFVGHWVKPNLVFLNGGVFLNSLAGGHLEGKLNFLPEWFLKGIDSGVDMHFHLGFALGIGFIGEGGLPVNFVLFGSDALVLDEIDDSDDDFDELDQDEEHEKT